MGAAVILGTLLCVATAFSADPGRGAHRRASEGPSGGSRGPCTYTFVLPESDHCQPSGGTGAAQPMQRDSPSLGDDESRERLQELESALENATQWLLKLEGSVLQKPPPDWLHTGRKSDTGHTVAILEIGANLLQQTAEQSRKVTDVESQVLNQTSRIKAQLLETSLSTNKLEEQLLSQLKDIHWLHNWNSALESRVRDLEQKHRSEMEGMQADRQELQRFVVTQSSTVSGLERTLQAVSSHAMQMQRQHLQLVDSVQSLVQQLSQGKVITKKDGPFRDCAQLRRAGHESSGVYTIHMGNMTDPKKVYCDMETGGGGWTVIQQRSNGSLAFQKNWKEYKLGFGDAAGEHWLGNEWVHLLTSQTSYSLRVELQDWDGNRAYGQYGTFRLGSERQLYRLFLGDYSGTAGPQSSLALHETNFSTRDSDNDNCLCKCAQMLSGGWWFDACGLSNLNGVYYSARHHLRKLNGIKWHYFRGPSYSLRGTRMMIRPRDI
ncbi:angiopoietin-4 [Ambystoma mexicanum]|uniref:angiopoietin-4 n=1 Tax=Ambystoma mexicanum TaxID=8296 RepID=UPI0037E89643